MSSKEKKCISNLNLLKMLLELLSEENPLPLKKELREESKKSIKCNNSNNK